ncbi:MAG: fibronectin type III domain-containing protein [Candidatus Cohnella colombiensis]|uniref:Fibronectin type III domain-containing protein n=1 Tax=Candidatus Cohnella colombiensis TaxID=3121368 RepID=A0AA95F374_9BACL|nr:MAG: fibronectin type III domain-containing protein [Cohnella sp.]
MKMLRNTLSLLLAILLLLPMAAQVFAESDIENVNKPESVYAIWKVTVSPGDSQLTISFPKTLTSGIVPDTFTLRIVAEGQREVPTPIILSTDTIESDIVSYTFTKLTNNTRYIIGVVASKEGERPVIGTAVGIPVIIPVAIDVKTVVGNGSVKLTFNKLEGKKVPTVYKINWWYKKDKKGKPIYEKPVEINSQNTKGQVVSYTFIKLNNGTTYHFDITAEKGADILGQTIDIKAAPKAPPKK